MAERNVVDQGDATLVGVWITPALEADYAKRGVYPHLRIKDAIAKDGTRGRFEVSIVEAREILKDASERYWACHGAAERGIKIAYGSLESRIRREVRNLEEAAAAATRLAIAVGGDRPTAQPTPGLLNAEGLARLQREGRLSRVMLDATKASPARLTPGCKVVLDEDASDEAEVLEDFDAYRVGDDDHLRLGYVVKRALDGGRYFFPAGSLSSANGKQTHLRLAWDATNQRRAS